MPVVWFLGIRRKHLWPFALRGRFRGLWITLILGLIAGFVLPDLVRRMIFLSGGVPPPEPAEPVHTGFRSASANKTALPTQLPSRPLETPLVEPPLAEKSPVRVNPTQSAKDLPWPAGSGSGSPQSHPPSEELGWAWVWYPGQWQKPPGMYYGRLSFSLDAEVVSAYLFFSADNFATLYLNGLPIGGSGDWYTLKPVGLKTLRPLLRQGRNVLAVRVQNDDHEGGFILKGQVLLGNGKTISLDSNQRWRCANQASEGWEKVEFDDSAWVASQRIGTPPAGPWGKPTMPGSHGPIARLDVGDPESEKMFSYTGSGPVLSGRYTYADGWTVADQGRRIRTEESFQVKLPGPGYLILVRQLAGGQTSDLEVFIDDQKAGLWQTDDPAAGQWAKGFFVVPLALTEGKSEVRVRLASVDKRPYVAWTYEFLLAWEWYLFGEEAVGSQRLGVLEQVAQAKPNDPTVAYRLGWAYQGQRRWTDAEAAYRRCLHQAEQGDLADAAWRRACFAHTMQAAQQARHDANRLFDLGLYLKALGFYEEAAELLAQSLALASAWKTYDQLAEALLWAGRPVQQCLKLWKEGLERFPPPRTNRWQGIVALRPSPEQVLQVAAQKGELQTMQDLIYVCSQGRMALQLQMLEHPPPWDRLIQPGQIDTLIEITGGAGGGATSGPDAGPAHAAWSSFGFVTPWDVAWHEWLHQFECALASSSNGPGWPGCHGSTQFGYRPPWWNWYRAAMRYYVQPGQYDRVCIGDHFAAPSADVWLIRGPMPWPNPTPWWICYPGKRHEAHFAWYHRKRFHLDQLPQKARLTLTADDRLIVWLNGRRLFQHGSWRSAVQVEVTPWLRHGENLLAVAVQNEDFDAGLLGLLEIEFADGQKTYLFTDSSWQTAIGDQKEFLALSETAEAVCPVWAQPQFHDTSWALAEQIGQYPSSPWNRIDIQLPDLLPEVLQSPPAGLNLDAPSPSEGWKPIRAVSKMIRLAEAARLASSAPSTKEPSTTKTPKPPQPGPNPLPLSTTKPDDPNAHQLTYAFTYVYCPTELRAQLALGSTWRAIVRLNGQTVLDHAGNGLPWLPRVAPIWLKQGWNRLLVAAEDLRQEGQFWLKICQPAGEPIPGLKYSSVKPQADLVADQHSLPRFDAARPHYYRWADVADDPYFLTPQLTEADLAQYTSYRDLKLQAGNNFLFLQINDSTECSGKAALGGQTQPLDLAPALSAEQPATPPKTAWSILAHYSGGEDRLNNALTWDDEPLCIVRFQRAGKPRDFLFIKPDALPLVLETHLLKVPEVEHPRHRLLGWLCHQCRLCLVAETFLGDLPQRTLELLEPP
ncbi:MAG: hypothetical protein RMI90_17055 [Thermoguttaceae bacterium]|nr:hypothetical protein [Thermoguttaceae bacterium]